jgi:transcriptional regulator with XRE-family HTH domain
MKSLHDERMDQGITQEMIERRTGITQEQISRIERGIVKPNQATREKIEKVLGMIDWAETKGIKLQGNYREAEMLVNKLVGIIPTLNTSDRKSIINLIHKYFK